jgi:type IV secretion system protein VirB3
MADTLFVACTRPTMKWGVPWDGVVVNAVATTVITIFVFGSPLGFSLFFAMHMGMRELCRVDPHFFYKWRLWSMTKAKSTTGNLWGGSRLQPSPSKIKRPTEVRSCL